MKTDAGKKLWVIAMGVVVGLMFVWFSTSTHGEDNTYEVSTHTLPEYKSDTARAIEAYERVMERFMDLTDSSFGRVSTDIKEIGSKLDAIDRKLTMLTSRIAGIETLLGIKHEKPNVCPAKKDEAGDIQKQDSSSKEIPE